MAENKSHKIIKDFEYKNHRCVVVEMFFLDNSCNGYVALNANEIKSSYDAYDMKCVELTFMGDLSRYGKQYDENTIYIGFDTSHSYNEVHPETKTPEAVEQVCKNIVDELLGEGR
jgi:hypothetical protein